MYRFHDLRINRRVDQERNELPIEAFNYAGHWLDREVDGYTTLVTSGRHTFERQVNSTNRVGDGATYLSSRLETRKIEVTFFLVANTIDEYNEQLDKLQAILSQPNKEFYFADDQAYRFTGTVTELSLDNDTLRSTGKITIEIGDPFRYGREITVSGNGSSIKITNAALTYEQTPERLTFTPSTTVANLTISCGGKVIRLTQGVQAGQPVAIDFYGLSVTINRVESMMAVALSSNLGDFYIKDGSTITFNTSGHYELIYEVKKL